MPNRPEKIRAAILKDSNGNPVGIILIPATDRHSKWILKARYDAFYQRNINCFTSIGFDGEYMIVEGNKLLFTSSGVVFAFVELDPGVAETLRQLIRPSKLGFVIKPEDGWCAFLTTDGGVKIVGPACVRSLYR